MAETMEVEEGEPKRIASVFEYLEHLEPTVLQRLYRDVWSCKAVFQSLDAMAKTYVMRLAFSTAVEEAHMAEWVEDPAAHAATMHRLRKLSLLAERGSNLCELQPTFRDCLREALTSPQEPWSEQKARMNKDSKRTTPEALEKLMQERWDQMLHSLVNPRLQDSSKVSWVFAVTEGLLVEQDNGEGLLTHYGYEYLLQPMHKQVWGFVFFCIRSTEARGDGSTEELLQLLFTLSYCEVGVDYPFEALTDNQKRLVNGFSKLGILFRRTDSRRFYTTPIAVGLPFGLGAKDAPPPSSSRPGAVMPVRTNMSIIVETNFQVVAYLETQLHLAMLTLFVEVRVHLPNVVVGVISRRSIQQALAMGISVPLILHFLQSHAHPEAAKLENPVPENVIDQICLWDAETKRVQSEEGVLVDMYTVSTTDPNVAHAFREVLRSAREKDLCLWAREDKCRMVVRREGFDLLQREYRRCIEQLQDHTAR